MLSIGTKVENFTLKNHLNQSVSLNDFLGKKVIIYFYAKDNTPGCTKEACQYRDLYPIFQNKDIVVIGISKDSVNTHAAFYSHQNLSFILLSDPEKQVIEQFGVYVAKKNYGKTYMGVARATFILNEQHEIIKVFPKANPNTNAHDVLQWLKNNVSI